MTASTPDWTAIARDVGTPAYVYDAAVIADRARRLRAALPDRVDLAYAVKANPATAVVGHLEAAGLGADVASAGELRLALAAGVPPERIVVTGPGKADALLAAAVRAGVRAVTVESLGELDRLELAAHDAGRPVGVLVRAADVAVHAENAGQDDEPHRLIGALPGKFGMDRGDLSAAVRRAAGSPWLDWLGVHAFTATNVTEADVLLGHAAATLHLAGELAGEAAQAVALVDLGGGLGIPYRDDDPSLDLGRLGAGLATLLEDHARDPRLAATRLLLEPGRWLVGPAGWYLTRIVDTKRVDGRAIAVVDGGIHHLLRPALVGQPHRISAVVPRERGVPQPVAVVGPLCTGLDALDPAACLPPLRPGDLLVVHDVGAYGFTESMPFFLSHPTPPEVLVEDARVRVIRPSFDPARWMDEAAIPAAILGA